MALFAEDLYVRVSREGRLQCRRLKVIPSLKVMKLCTKLLLLTVAKKMSSLRKVCCFLQWGKSHLDRPIFLLLMFQLKIVFLLLVLSLT